MPMQITDENIGSFLADYVKTTELQQIGNSLTNYVKRTELLQTRIVSDSNGSITAQAGTIQPVSSGGVEDLYQFYAVTTTETDKQSISMSLPVGGFTSGLYRFPRVGEKVLVMYDGSKYFLLGYVPIQNDTTNSVLPNITASDFPPKPGEAPPAPPETRAAEKNTKEKGKLDTEQGLILRYKKTGSNDSGADKYSEIGFYNEQTSWKPTGAVADSAYPKIDQINIQSTGDIHAKAQNHYQTQAKRFELLVDCAPIDHTTEEQPFGDRPGDDSFLYAGDAHIRANNRIIIKAGEEIRLEVGRSSIIINDAGIILASRKIDSNIENSWDTLINLNHRSGLIMFGQHVNISAGMDFAINESFGGSIGSTLGVMRLSAKDILAKAFSTANYIKRGIFMGVDVANNAASMASGIAGQGNKRDLVNAAGPYGRIVTQLIGGIWGDKQDPKYAAGTDTIGTLGNFVGTLYSILKIVYIVIELTIPKEKLKAGGKDGLSMATAVFEYGIALAAFGSIALKNMVSAIHASTLQLGGNAEATITAPILNLFTTAHIQDEGPIMGVEDGSFLDTVKGALKNHYGKIIGAVLGAAGFVATAGIFAPKAMGKDDNLRQELMAL